MSEESHLQLARHYQECLELHGDSARGMDWPNQGDNQVRFRIMTELFIHDLQTRPGPIRLMDFACGTSHYYDYLRQEGLTERICYLGIDINEQAIAVARSKFPENEYYACDILRSTFNPPIADYIVINGLFTQKNSMSEKQMRAFLHRILMRLDPFFTKGLAFNAMSGQVDYRKNGAFHLDLNWISNLIVSTFSRNFVLRHDYGLYENTIYVLKAVGQDQR